ncbi:glycoside hydrolase family 26 protein [Gemmatimonas groenlandica]|uniref:Endoglucanase n=1 Tax=Gemmatimonas groenlandica TaxID=2732249 RepID=A0A6M4IIR3_9BACT|nr:glycosyl hydrolase [Gemmatimonas groenlandica]QJR34673.1 endoglucanase [Gemmatimonas groenlandica]
MRPALLAFAATVCLSACESPARIAAPDVLQRSAITSSTATGSVGSGVFLESSPLGKLGLKAWDTWTTKVGGRSAYVMWYTDWSSNFQGFAVTSAYDRASTPVITWEMKNRRGKITYADVLAGKHNTYIDSWATDAKADGRPIVVRLGHEMNGDWYGWGGAQNGGSEQSPAQFIAMWRYVRGRFQTKNVTNVSWAWCVNHESVPNASWNQPENYYPGDAYVDWICADGYNWGTSQTWSSWKTFDEVFAPIYGRLTTLAPTKPFMIGEFASSELGGSKATWITAAASSMATSYPQLRAFMWFNMNKETDWRVESSASSLAAFRSAFVGDPVFAWK